MKYAITRIHGNELYPRDEPKSKLKALRFVLEHEPAFIDCKKVWILNQIHDDGFKKESIEILEEFNQEWHEILFDSQAYKACETWDEKIVQLININKARNIGLELSRPYFLNFLFDGDCFFTKELWDKAISEIENDQKSNDRQYYGIPYIRATDKIPEDYLDFPTWEPAIAFRDDSKIRFDESIPFSKNDKVELLVRLGYDRSKGQTALSNTLCKNVSSLIHISFSDPKIEENLSFRMDVRAKSLERLICKFDNRKMFL